MMSLNKCREIAEKRNIRVDMLAMLFGLGSWLGVNAMYLQLPLFVTTAPEGWNLPSYLVIVVQIGNVGPLLYTIFQKYSKTRIHDHQYIYFIFAIGCIASILLAFFHQETAFIAGQQRSIALFLLAFLFAFVGCTSSVLFMPYMGRFREIYLITYLVGEGFSGFLPSIVALIQGVGGNPQCIPNPLPDGPSYVAVTPPPRFSIKAYFIFVFVVMCCSAISFLLLNKLKLCRQEYANVTVKQGNKYEYRIEENECGDDDSENNKDHPVKHLSTGNLYYLIVVMALVSLLGSGVFPGIQSFSCLPYGNVPYHLTVTLSSIANPLACFLAVFLEHTSISHITGLTGITLLISMYAMATAIVQPLLGSVIGDILVVSSWILLMGLISYIKLSVIAIFRNRGGTSLVMIGFVSQLGSFIGSIITFCLVNNTSIFVSHDPCASL